MLKNKEAVIFDLDGTLVDSMWIWKDIDIEFLARYGHTCPDHLERTIEGMSFSETAVYFQEHFQLPLTVSEIKECWTQMSLHQYKYHVPLKKGVAKFLVYLKNRGLKTGIATSNGIEIVDAVIDSLNIRQYFQEIVTACEVPSGKPSPDIYLEAARRLNVDSAHCMVFEDIPAGIMAGKRAGMTVYAVEDHFSEHLKDEKQALADYYITDYLQLLNILENGAQYEI